LREASSSSPARTDPRSEEDRKTQTVGKSSEPQKRRTVPTNKLSVFEKKTSPDSLICGKQGREGSRLARSAGRGGEVVKKEARAVYMEGRKSHIFIKLKEKKKGVGGGRCWSSREGGQQDVPDKKEMRRSRINARLTSERKPTTNS